MDMMGATSKSTFYIQMWEVLEDYERESIKERFASVKCADTTKKLRAFGAVFSSQKYYINAIEMFNQALCFAPVDTPMVGILFSNRGNAYYSMGLYHECINSLKLALKYGYPGEMRHHLVHKIDVCKQRIAKGVQCEKRRRSQDKCNRFRVRLSYPAHPKVPSVIEGLHVEDNNQFGRHVVTDVDLKVGDVICIEEAFVKIIAKTQRYKRCTNCLEELQHKLIPCQTCTNAMFCSVACQDIAWAQFHKYECRLSDELFGLQLETGRLAFRVLLVVLNQFGHDIEQFRRFLMQNAPRPGQHVFNPFDLDYTHPCTKKQFLAYYNGYAEDSHFPAHLRIANELCAITLTSLLANYTSYSAQMRCERTKFYMINLLRHFININSNNCYDVANSSAVEGRSSNCIGIFLCMSMATHACAGNVTRMRVDSTKQMWMVTRSIPAGSQVLDNYGSFFQYQSKEERQERCLNHYGFRCQCDACTHDFPMQGDLQEAPGVPYPRESHLGAKGSGELSVEEATAELRVLRKYMTKYNSHYPCLQLWVAETALTSLFKQITDDAILENRFPEYFSRGNMVDMHHDDT